MTSKRPVASKGLLSAPAKSGPILLVLLGAAAPIVGRMWAYKGYHKEIRSRIRAVSYSLGQAITGQASATSAGVAAADTCTAARLREALARGRRCRPGASSRRSRTTRDQEQAASLTCPAGFLFSPTPKSPYMTCVNQTGVHVAYAEQRHVR